MLNTSLGATAWEWEFSGGEPQTSNNSTPTVRFTGAGEHLIKLTVSNGRETYSTEKTVTVQPAMTIGFDWSVDAIDNDYQAPVTLHLHNQSINAFSYQWSILGAQPVASTEENPDILFPTAGNYTIVLNSINDKETKTLQKQITINEDKNLLTFENVHLGINTAQNTIGCFFSSVLGKVILKNEVNESNGSLIDFAYFGLNDLFNFNQFISPDEVQTTAFLAIPDAIHTKIINSQELVGVQLSASQFDAIDNGAGFKNLTINESAMGNSPFDNATVPRVALFQTVDGRKGAVKITGFVSSEKESYITVTVKVQKKAQ
jgi:PKD repeat protein